MTQSDPDVTIALPRGNALETGVGRTIGDAEPPLVHLRHYQERQRAQARRQRRDPPIVPHVLDRDALCTRRQAAYNTTLVSVQQRADKRPRC